MSSPLRPVVITVMAAVLAHWIVGCEAAGFALHPFFPNQVPAAYAIANRPTLVMVDDPRRLLGPEQIADLIAARAGFELTEAGALTRVVPADQLVELRSELGDEYRKTPIDAIGRRLGAEQVIHVHVDSAQMSLGPDIAQPGAKVRVKLIDASAGARLFPPTVATEADPGGAAQRGYPVATEMTGYAIGRQGQTDTRVLQQRLAQLIGRDVALLFFAHPAPEPGQGLSE